MLTHDLKERIEEAQRELQGYPGWVAKNSIFQGGPPSEYRNYEDSIEEKKENTKTLSLSPHKV